MFSLLMTAFFFIAVIVIGALIAVGLLFSRRSVLRPRQKKEDPNIIDVQALDDNQPARDSSNDPQLKP